MRAAQVTARLCVLLLYVTTSTLHAVQSMPSPPDQRQQAVCSLTLQGHSNPKVLGIATAALHCDSSRPIPIAINATYLGNFAPRFTGVQIINSLACQQHAKGYSIVKGERVPLFALLYFCGDYHLNLQRPTVQNVSLPYADSGWDSAAVAFGAQTEVSIHQGKFAGNSAGSILIALQEATVNVTDGTVFEYNVGKNGAGLMALDKAKLALADMSLQFNHAVQGGSVLVAHNASVSINNTEFFNNTALRIGGAVNLESSETAVVANSTFSHNYAKFGGGLLVWIKAKVVIWNSYFRQNAAAVSGGAVGLANYSMAVIDGGAYTGNQASAGGGGLYCDYGSLVTLKNSAIANNSAAQFGGGLAAINNAYLTIVNDTWHSNTAAKGAGLAVIRGSSVLIGRNTSAALAIIANTFTNNNAIEYGGGMYLEGLIEVTATNNTWHSNTAHRGAGMQMVKPPSPGPSDNLTAVLHMTGNTFVNNSADDAGGGLSLEDHVQATITQSTFSTNMARIGGALGVRITADLTVAGTSFSNNTARGGGGAVYNDVGGAALVSSCTFSSNIAGDGGAIYHNTQHNSLTITHSIMQHNMASANGGGLFSSSSDIGKINITAVDCTGNYADGTGGAMAISGTANAGANGGSGFVLVTITSSSFNTNKAGTAAGLGLEGYVKVLVDNNCSFAGNAATFGGALYLASGANLTISNSTVQGNSASTSGGALYQADMSTVLVTAGSVILNNTAAGAGGGVFCSNARVFLTADSVVRGNRAPAGGGFAAQGTTWVLLESSTLYGNWASKGGGVELHDAAQAFISGCVITNNAAGSGGGLFAADAASMALVDSLVANNTALQRGAGIVLDERARLLLLGNTSVTKNAADHGSGGGLASTNGGFDLVQVKRAVQGNTALYNKNIDPGVANITIIGNTRVADFVNSAGDEGLLHVAVNFSGAHGLPCQGTLVQALLDDKTFLDTNRSDQHGITYLSFKVNRPPGLYTILTEIAGVGQLLAANLSLHIRSCVRGEVAPTPDTCQRCQPGYFSFDPQQAVCETCPANAYCTGGDVILPLPGYWRSSAGSMQVHRCPNPSACSTHNETARQSCGSEPACGASHTFKDLQCSPDYIGNLCGVCAAGRGAIKPFVCRPCMNTGHIIALYALAVIVMLLFIKLLCYLTLNQARNVHLGGSSKPPVAELLRPLVLYSQYMLIVSSINIDWPVSLSYPLKVLAWVWSPTSPETLSIDCLLAKNSSLPVSIQKVLFYVCMPVALLLLLMLIELASLGFRRLLLAMRARRHAVVVNLKDRLLSSTLVAIFFFLPSVLRTLFSIFACTLIDEPAAKPYAPAAVGSFWVFDMNQQCFAGYHKAWALGMGLPLVLMVCLGIPVGLLALLLRNRSYLQEEWFMQQYGFLYKSYKSGSYCWECVVLCQTMLLVATSVFGVNLGVFYQLIIINGIFVVIVVMLLVCRPYSYLQAGHVMLQAICCLLLTSYVSLTFLQVGIIQPSPIYGVIMGSLVLVVNLAFIVSVLWQMALLVDWQGLVSIVHRLVLRLLQGVGLLGGQKDNGPVAHPKAASAVVGV